MLPYIVREQWQLHIFEKYKYEKVICIKQFIVLNKNCLQDFMRYNSDIKYHISISICNFAKEHLSKEQKDDQATKSI